MIQNMIAVSILGGQIDTLIATIQIDDLMFRVSFKHVFP